MDPRTDYEDADMVTTRAFITMFRRVGEQFQFSIDGHADDSEVRAHLIIDDRKHGGETTIGVTSIDNKDNFETIRNTLDDMGVTILEEEISEEPNEEIGEYTAFTLEATAPSSLSADWNVPHLLVYGSLSPEVREACYAAFGSDISVANVRNHFVVYGEGVTERAKDELASAVQQSDEFFDDHRRDVVSSIRTAELI
jgi:hypothetical protein